MLNTVQCIGVKLYPQTHQKFPFLLKKYAYVEEMHNDIDGPV